jgi:hypothetical protein
MITPERKTGGVPISERPAIPAGLRRDVEMEAGHRCAIPTCRNTPIEVAHIDSWAKVQEHTFGNLIALCPTCHTRYDRGDIDRQSMLRYKTNLSDLNGRYGDVERRVLQIFADNPDVGFIDQPGGLQLFYLYLMRDGYLVCTGLSPGATQIQGMNTYERYVLTPEGRAFIQRWLSAEPLS